MNEHLGLQLYTNNWKQHLKWHWISCTVHIGLQGPNSHIDYFEIIGNYCAGLPLTCTLKTNLEVVFRDVRTLNQVVL